MFFQKRKRYSLKSNKKKSPNQGKSNYFLIFQLKNRKEKNKLATGQYQTHIKVLQVAILTRHGKLERDGHCIAYL
jgi:hypothetical protein